MAELVDALVSNTNAARRAGSIPALGTKNPKTKSFRIFLFQISKFYSISSDTIKLYLKSWDDGTGRHLKLPATAELLIILF